MVACERICTICTYVGKVCRAEVAEGRSVGANRASAALGRHMAGWQGISLPVP